MKVTSQITVEIKGTEFLLTQQEARELLNALKSALGESYVMPFTKGNAPWADEPPFKKLSPWEVPAHPMWPPGTILCEAKP